MNCKTLVILAAVISLYHHTAAQGQSVKIIKEKTGKIHVEIQRISNNSSGDSLQVGFASLQAPGRSRKWFDTRKALIGGKAIWSYDATGPAYVHIPFLSAGITWFSEAGDSVTITIDGNDVQFSGKTAEKFRLQYELISLRSKMKMKVPTKGHLLATPLTLKQYFEWISWVNEYEKQLAPLIGSYENKMPGPSLKLIDDQQKSILSSTLNDAFGHLIRLAMASNLKLLTLDDLCNIYDSTIAYKIERWYPFTDGYMGEAAVLKTYIDRKNKFGYDRDPLNSKLKKRLIYYEEGLKLFKDLPLSREHFLVHMFTEEFLPDVVFTPKIKELLDAYYAEPGYPEIKAYVKDYEAQGYRLLPGRKGPEYSLTDMEDRIFNSRSLAGKIVLMDFWFTGCVGCVDMVPVLKRIEDEFKGDTNVVFLSISADKDKSKWLKSIAEKKYTTGTATNLYTNGNGSDDYMLRAYMVSSFPTVFLLDAENWIVENPLPSPRKDNGEYLINLIRRQRVLMNDGPYIMRKGDSLISYAFTNSSVTADRKVLKKNKHSFNVQTDQYGKSFPVTLKKHLQNEPAEFPKPEKLLALSDIEGNFDALRKLLQSNRVIDEHYNWIFGKGHLVFNGDIFDRGEQVTECLWLIYSLEEKAKASGGYVHFILGNHEIMNMSGRHDYVRSKYNNLAAKLGRSYADLYNAETELGRWLRTKNIMEKIGDLLFVHGGVSQQMNDVNLSVTLINELARPFYDRDSIARVSANKEVTLIYDAKGQNSPFWCRSYYKGDPSGTQVDGTLKKYKVNHIITGHTIVEPGDKLITRYNNKVINTDTRHKEGKSEALLVEGNKYYRVNAEGNRVLLFSDDK